MWGESEHFSWPFCLISCRTSMTYIIDDLVCSSLHFISSETWKFVYQIVCANPDRIPGMNLLHKFLAKKMWIRVCSKKTLQLIQHSPNSEQKKHAADVVYPGPLFFGENWRRKPMFAVFSNAEWNETKLCFQAGVGWKFGIMKNWNKKFPFFMGLLCSKYGITVWP